MADSLVRVVEQKAPLEVFSVTDTMNGSSSLSQRRIEFHPARKPFKGFSKSGDFHIETLNLSTSSESGRSVLGAGQLGFGGKKADGSEVLENGLDLELGFGITFRRIGAGLENLGNTCFLNSVLQCLTYTEPLAAYLQSGKHENSCHIAGFCALCAIQKHVSRALQSTGRSLAPKDLVSNLRCISRNFHNARQEDAHEYMVNLLESMHKCCLPSGVPSESPSAYEKSLVHKIFGGSLRSQVKCLQCSFCSNKFDPFLDLSLEIIKADSLYKALQNFTAAELLDGGEKQYQCQRCKQKVRAHKQLAVHKPPYVLTIHLKRFGAHDPGQKIDKKVHFTPSLDLGPFVSVSHVGDLKYTLYGVLVHYGWSTHSGHYYCYVRTSSGMWYSLDDSRVVQVSEKTVLEQRAYMLFYVRDRSNVAPRKPLHVSQKENSTPNECRTKTSSTYNQPLKRPVQNGSTEIKPSDVASSAVAQKDASDVGPPGIPVSNGSTEVKSNDVASSIVAQKDASDVGPPRIPVSNGSTEVQPNDVASSAVAQKDASDAGPPRIPVSNGTLDQLKSELLLTASSLKDSLEKPPFLAKNPSQCFKPSAPPSNKNDACKLKTGMATATMASRNGLNEKGSLTKELCVSTFASPNLEQIQSSAPAENIINNTSQENALLHVENSRKVSPKEPIPLLLEKIDSIKQPELPSCEKIQVGNTTNANAADNSLDKAGCCSQNSVNHESVKLSEPSTVANGSFHLEVSDCKSHKRLKKKILRWKVIGMHFRSSIFLGVTLALRKKKKHKRSKRKLLDTKTLGKELLMAGNCFPTDDGPSTSEMTQTILTGSNHSQRKEAKSRLQANGTATKNSISSCGDSLKYVVNSEFKERSGQNGSVLATDEQLHNHSGFTSSGNQFNAGETGSLQDCKRKNGWMDMLTRGVKDTVVARWDGIEPPSDTVKSHVSIGYVPDEWDEEYDRGKRKKVKQAKRYFGGGNPFQATATKKIKLKDAKMERFTSGNQPFRI